MPINPCFMLHIYFCLKTTFWLPFFPWTDYSASLHVVLSLYFQTRSLVWMCPQKLSTAIWNRELAKSQKSLPNRPRFMWINLTILVFSFSLHFLIVKSDGNFYKLKTKNKTKGKPHYSSMLKFCVLDFSSFSQCALWEAQYSRLSTQRFRLPAKLRCSTASCRACCCHCLTETYPSSWVSLDPREDDL